MKRQDPGKRFDDETLAAACAERDERVRQETVRGLYREACEHRDRVTRDHDRAQRALFKIIRIIEVRRRKLSADERRYGRVGMMAGAYDGDRAVLDKIDDYAREAYDGDGRRSVVDDDQPGDGAGK